MDKPRCALALVAFIASLLPQGANAQDKESSPGQEAGLAQKLTNPVADLISVPFQSNLEYDGGPEGDGTRYTMNFQPVIPISLNEEWNLISRTIVPFIDQEDMVGSGSQSSVGDVVQSLFLSPKEAGERGWIWGVGPVFLLPTATDDVLGSEKFGLGPTAVMLKQVNGWTYGALANHIWSVAGDDDRQDVSATFLQPFVSYTTPAQTTYTLNTESTYDWESSQWTAPINISVAQLVMIGDRSVQFQLGAKHYAEGPRNAPDWGIRFSITLLFPE